MREVQRHRLARRAAPARAEGRRADAAQEAERRSRCREREIIEFDASTRSAPARSASPAQRAFYIQARKGTRSSRCSSRRSRSRCSPTEAVAFLDRIADEHPELPFDAPAARRRTLREPTVPLFRARLIGLGFDPERELVLLELRERADEDDDEDAADADDDDDEGYVARIYATARAGAGDGGARRRGRRRRPAAVPAVRLPMDPAGHICPRWN